MYALSQRHWAVGCGQLGLQVFSHSQRAEFIVTHRNTCSTPQENYFFALTKYQDQLSALIEGTDFVQPPSRRNEVLGWVKEGVRDFSISRSNVDWGIRMPQDAEHTVYVWFDALNGAPRGLCVCGCPCVRARQGGWAWLPPLLSAPSWNASWTLPMTLNRHLITTPSLPPADTTPTR